MLTATPLADWKMYLRWHLVHAAAEALALEVRGREFQFLRQDADRNAGNAAAMEALRASRTDQELGEALGQIYVKKAISAGGQGARA